MATGYLPTYLLWGYIPVIGSSLLHSPDSIPWYYSSEPHHKEITPEIPDNDTLCPKALEIIELFKAEWQQAQEALQLSQYFQKRAYNRGQLSFEFEEGKKVLINPHSLSLLRTEKRRGRKSLMKYDGPFEIIKKICPISYRLRMPASLWNSSSSKYRSFGKISNLSSWIRQATTEVPKLGRFWWFTRIRSGKNYSRTPKERMKWKTNFIISYSFQRIFRGI